MATLWNRVLLYLPLQSTKGMLALALKVCTQKMFIISEAHLSGERKNILSAWDATFLVYSEENTIWAETQKRKGERWNSYNQTQNYLLKGKGSFKRTERRVFGEYKEKVRVKLDKVSHRDIEREGVIVLIGKGEWPWKSNAWILLLYNTSRW